MNRTLDVATSLFATLSRFSHDVRNVVAVGLSGGGFSIGVGFALLMFGAAGRPKG